MKQACVVKLAIGLVLLSCSAAAATTVQEVRFVRIVAPSQAIVVTTRRGTHTAMFSNEAQLFPRGRAAGVLALSTPEGALLRFRVAAGVWRLAEDGTVAEAWMLLQGDREGDVAIAVVRPEPQAQDCLIYDILGTQVHARFEAHGRVAVFRD